MSIIIVDIDELLINNCDLVKDFRNIILINKYYQILITKNELFKQWNKIKVHEKRHKRIERKWGKRYPRNETLFIYSCQLGLLLFAKYLVRTYKINVHIDNECAFIRSYKYGQIEMVEFLIDLITQPNHYICAEFNNY